MYLDQIQLLPLPNLLQVPPQLFFQIYCPYFYYYQFACMSNVYDYTQICDALNFDKRRIFIQWVLVNGETHNLSKYQI